MDKNCLGNKNPLKGISKLSRCEILALISSVSMILSEGLDDDDLAMLSVLLNALGDTVGAFGAIKENDET
jgi:hypothetical protein